MFCRYFPGGGFYPFGPGFVFGLTEGLAHATDGGGWPGQNSLFNNRALLPGGNGGCARRIEPTGEGLINRLNQERESKNNKIRSVRTSFLTIYKQE
jgi:hypothetical protein